MDPDDSPCSNDTNNMSSNSSSCEYNYVYDDDSALPLGEVLPVGVVYSLTLLLGLVGNGLVIFAISYYGRMRTVTNIFLLSLASADLMLVLICVPVKGVAFFTFTWKFGESLCRLVNYVQSYSMICSVLTLTAISLERLVAVVFPLRAKYLCTMSHARLVVVIVWIVSGILALPTVFIMHHMAVGINYEHFWCVKSYDHPVFIVVYESYMFILMFVLPVVVMTIAYSVIGVKVWGVSKMRTGGVVMAIGSESKQRVAPKPEENDQTYLDNGHKQTTQWGSKRQSVSEETKTRKQVVLMLVLVLCLFVLCWGPILVNNLLTAWKHLDALHYGFLKPMRQAFHLMSYFNSCINPVVYAFMSRNFRQSFKMAICACVKGRAFVRAYRFSISLASSRTSATHTNGRLLTTYVEKDGGSSGNEVAGSPTFYDPERLELRKISV